MTNLLMIDTSTDHPAVGVSHSGGSLQVPSLVPAGRHGRELIPRIGDLLRETGLTVRDLRVVAVGLGPGSYTGLRIGLTAARTLAYTAGATLLGLDSLEGWARTAPPEAVRVHVVSDAQRGDVYAADFVRGAADQPLQRLIASRIESLASWSLRLDCQGYIVGPGLETSRIMAAIPLGAHLVTPSSGPARTLALLEMARQLHADGRSDDLWTLEPNYLRRSAAEETWQKKRPQPS